MVVINPLDVFLWTVRRNEKDVVKMYDALSPVMQLATKASMLNFGYWTDDVDGPSSAQENLCSRFANLAELDGAKAVADVGSGLSAPAMLWKTHFPSLNIHCINTNYSQLRHAGSQDAIIFLNSTATKIPLRDGTMDRVLALESSQHFRPYADFISESRRVLNARGILALALPVALTTPSISNLGALKFTWSSEHYILADIRAMLQAGGFDISKELLIGHHVYEPLADFYVKNRHKLQKSIKSRYPSYVESILFHSIQRMKQASENGVIDYALFKCRISSV